MMSEYSSMVAGEDEEQRQGSGWADGSCSDVELLSLQIAMKDS